MRNWNFAPKMPMPAPDPIVISDTDDSDVEIIMARPVENRDEEIGDEETSDANNDIQDCITVIPESPCPERVPLPGHSTKSDIQESITVALPEPTRPAELALPVHSTSNEETSDEETMDEETMDEENERQEKTIDAGKSHTDRGDGADGAPTD